MAGYVIADVRVTDEALFAEFAAGVPATIEAHGGRYIIRGGNIEVFQGDWAPPRFVVVEFESAEQASGWLNSEEFSAMRELLNRSSDSDVIVMEGT